MNFAAIIRGVILLQEALNGLTVLRVERQRILRVIQLAEDTNTLLTPEMVAIELADLTAAIEEAKASIPADPTDIDDVGEPDTV